MNVKKIQQNNICIMPIKKKKKEKDVKWKKKNYKENVKDNIKKMQIKEKVI